MIFNVAMSVLDEHLHRPWKPGGSMETSSQRARRRAKGLPNWRICRYADDPVLLVHGTRADAETLAKKSLMCSHRWACGCHRQDRIVHMSEAFDSSGSASSGNARGGRKSGTSTPSSPTGPSGHRAKIRALTNRTSQQDLRSVLIRLNQIMRGWASYFKHAVCKHTLGNLAHFAWWRVIRWLRTLHRWSWKDVRRAFTTPQGGGSRSRQTGSSCSTWKPYRTPGTATAAARSPAPGVLNHA